MQSDTPAARIAMDLATAIRQQLIGPGAQLPSQTELMKAYGVAMGTAASALAKVREAGLVRSQVGSGVYVILEPQHTDVAVLYRAGDLCRTLAASGFLPGTTPMVEVATFYDHERGETVGRPVDATPLAALDRTVLRALGDTYVAAARRIVGHGSQHGDATLVESAKAILRDAARRPDNQYPIPFMSAQLTDDDCAGRRLWPERYANIDVDSDAPF